MAQLTKKRKNFPVKMLHPQDLLEHLGHELWIGREFAIDGHKVIGITIDCRDPMCSDTELIHIDISSEPQEE